MIKAVIFDFDGVIADTEHIHFEAFRNVLQSHHYYLTEQQYYSSYLAYDDKTFFAKYYDNNSLNLDEESLNQLLKSKSEVFDKLISNNIKIYPGVVDFIKEVASKYCLAIGSGALKKEITQILEAIHIADLFEIIVAADDVIECKPNPEVYNTVLKQLNSNKNNEIKPHECIVIEDSVFGIEAAKSAGMKCLAITNSYPKEKLKDADIIINSFINRDILSILSFI